MPPITRWRGVSGLRRPARVATEMGDESQGGDERGHEEGAEAGDRAADD